MSDRGRTSPRAREASGERLARVTFTLPAISEYWPPFGQETLWVRWTALELGAQIANVPFFVFGVAFNDLIRVVPVEDRDELLFGEVVHQSGRSVLRLLINDPDSHDRIEQWLALNDCPWEVGTIKNHLAVDVPAWVDYGAVLGGLIQFRDQDQLGIEEAALSAVHSAQLRAVERRPLALLRPDADGV